MPIQPPKRLPPPDALDVELREMAIAAERGFPRFPPPPPPLDALAAAAARAQSAPLMKRRSLDSIQILARLLMWLVVAAFVVGAWAFLRSLSS